MEKSFDSQSPQQKRPQVLAVRYQPRALSQRQKICAWAAGALALLIVIASCWYVLGYSSSSFIDTGKFQAVFTTNNQAYFGKLQRLSDGAYRLTDVYYLQQAGSTAQKPDSSGQTPQLVKMGKELHGPDDAVIFPSEQVQFWENLRSDSKVTKAIQEYTKK